MPVAKNEYNERSRGGTELSIAEFERHVDPELLSKFQVVPSRFRGLEDGLIPIYWLHDLPADPEMHHLAAGGWEKFRHFVFVSNWQMQGFIDRYGIPWSRCSVLHNAIERFDPSRDWGKWENVGTEDNPLRFIYHTTPHRGLDVLVNAFAGMSSQYEGKMHLDVYSSFNIYGWPERDVAFKGVFDYVREHPMMTYHGARPNAEVRDALRRSHVFLYPCTWPETGCRALIEAMCAGLFCIHSNYGCLFETGLGSTIAYQYTENAHEHVNAAASMIRALMDGLERNGPNVNYLRTLSDQSNAFYAWDRRGGEWNSLFKSLLEETQ